MNITLLLSFLSPLESLLIAGIIKIITTNSTTTKFNNIFLYYDHNSSDLANGLLFHLLHSKLNPYGQASVSIKAAPFQWPKNDNDYRERVHISLIQHIKKSQLHIGPRYNYEEKNILLAVFTDMYMMTNRSISEEENDEHHREANYKLKRIWYRKKFSKIAMIRGRLTVNGILYFDAFTRNPYTRTLRCNSWSFGELSSYTSQASDIFRDITTTKMYGAQLTAKVMVNHVDVYNVITRPGSSLGERRSIGGMTVNKLNLMAERLNASLRFLVPILPDNVHKLRNMLLNISTPIQLHDDNFRLTFGTNVEYFDDPVKYAK